MHIKKSVAVKGLISLLLVLGLFVGFLNAGIYAAEQKKIGVTHQWLGNDWNKWLWKGTKEKLEELGYKVVLGNGRGDTASQQNYVDDWIESGFAGIIINGGESQPFADSVKRAYEEGIPVVCTDMVHNYSVSNVFTNNYEGGVKMAMWLMRQMGGTGQYIELRYPGWHSIQKRWTGAKDVFADFSAESVGYKEATAHSPIDTAYKFTKAKLRSNPDLEGIYCGWGLPAIGAVKAVREMGKEEQVSVVAADSPRLMLQKMQEGLPRFATLGQDSRFLGHKAAKLLDEAIKIGDVKTAREKLPVVDFGPTLMISNGNPKSAFSEVKRLSPEEAWDIAYSDEPKPWE